MKADCVGRSTLKIMNLKFFYHYYDLMNLDKCIHLNV